MDQARTVDTGRLREAMHTTRASIRDTVEELREKVGDAVDWRHYVDRYPGTSLAVAAVIGAFVGRQIGTMILGRANGFGRSAARPTNTGPSPGFTPAPAQPVAKYEAAGPGNRERSVAFESLSASLGRAGSRLESLLNRLIDELGDTAERMLVPMVVARIQSLFPSGERAGRRHSGEEAAAGRYPGTPAGTAA